MPDPTGRVSHLPDMHRGVAWKEPCRVATTANITLSGTQTIDGISVVAEDRVLVKSQTAGAENGIYICKSGAWLRAFDMDQDSSTTTIPASEVMGAFVYVRAGTVNGGKLFYATNATAPTLGSTTITFAEFAQGTYSLTIKDEGTPLATGATSIDFVGSGVVASGTGAAKTVTITTVAALDDLTDVTITSPASADRLRYNGSVWANSSLIWTPLTVYNGTDWLPLVDGDGNAIMAEA